MAVEHAKARITVDKIEDHRATADRDDIGQNVVGRRNDLFPGLAPAGRGKRDGYHPSARRIVIGDREELISHHIAAKDALRVVQERLPGTVALRIEDEFRPGCQVIGEQQDVTIVTGDDRANVEMAGFDRFGPRLGRIVDEHAKQGLPGADIRRIHAHVEEAAVVRQPGEIHQPLARQSLGQDLAGFDLHQLDDGLFASAGGVGEDRQRAAVRQSVGRHLQRLVGAQRVQIDDAVPRTGGRVRKLDHRQVLTLGDEPMNIASARENREHHVFGRPHRFQTREKILITRQAGAMGFRQRVLGPLPGENMAIRFFL